METNSITDYIQTLHDIVPAIQLGLFPDPTIGYIYHKFAESDNITTTQSIISSCPNQDPYNTAGDPLYISSASTSATQIIYLEGVDMDYNLASETITLQGQTGVAISTTFRTIFKGYNINGTPLTGDVYIGTEAVPVGGIPDDSNMYANIPATYNGEQANQTLTSIFTIPANYTGFILRWYTTAQKGRDINLVAYARKIHGVFRYQDRMSVFESSIEKEMPWLRFPEKTDFKVEGITSTGTIPGVVTYDLVLLRNDFINEFRPLRWR